MNSRESSNIVVVLFVKNGKYKQEKTKTTRTSSCLFLSRGEKDKSLKALVRLEPPTPGLQDKCSIN